MAPPLANLPEVLVALLPWLVLMLAALCLGLVYEVVVNRGLREVRLTPKERAEAEEVRNGPGQAVRYRVGGPHSGPAAQRGGAVLSLPVPKPAAPKALSGQERHTGGTEGAGGTVSPGVIGFCVDCDRTQQFNQFGKCAVCGSAATLFRGGNRGGLDRRVRGVVQFSVGGRKRCGDRARPKKQSRP